MAVPKLRVLPAGLVVAAAISVPTSAVASGSNQKPVQARSATTAVACNVAAQVPVKLSPGDVVARGTVRCPGKTVGWTETSLQIRRSNGTWLTIAQQQRGFTAPAGRTLHFRSPRTTSVTGTVRTRFTGHIGSRVTRRTSPAVVINY